MTGAPSDMRRAPPGALVTAALSFLIALTAGRAAAQGAPGDTVCSSVSLEVSAARGQSGPIPGTLCVPPGATTVELLLHGTTYGQYYWDLPLEPETYSFVRAANERGFATLNVDRLGTVGAFQPLSIFVTLDTNASVVDQLVGALRDGTFGPAFDNVVLVGHSYGSLIAYLAAGRFGGVDALIATGASHQLNAVNILTRVLASSPPAILDPKFASTLLDPGYITTLPGRRRIFYEVSQADPAVIALDEQLKQTSTVEEAVTVLPDFIFNASRSINLPVLTVNGEHEPYFCNGLLAGDCSSSEALAAGERRFYGPGASVEAIVIPDAGHNLTLERTAPTTNAAIQEWLAEQGF